MSTLFQAVEKLTPEKLASRTFVHTYLMQVADGMIKKGLLSQEDGIHYINILLDEFCPAP